MMGFSYEGDEVSLSEGILKEEDEEVVDLSEGIDVVSHITESLNMTIDAESESKPKEEKEETFKSK